MRTLRSAAAAFALLALMACRKEEAPAPEQPQPSYTVAVDHSLAEFYFNDAMKQTDIALKDNEVPCAVAVTIDLQAQPHTLLIDFGDDNCMAADGLTRRGRLFVTFTGAYGDEGTVIVITPQDYHVNDHLVQGSKTVTNAGANGQGQTYFTVAVDGTVTAPDGSWTSSHHAQRTRTWIAGEGTLTPFDDVYLIAGGGGGVSRHGTPYTLQITAPLRVEVGCPWIVSGTEDIIPEGGPTYHVDFGDGCNSQVSVTVYGMTFTFG
ncbi:MAG: hypothetical protein RBT71_07235 [Flavobacteriales bacterium]|jgi:hypothetical protein|nr:hypothetical protein [Flavobacteriales bacterium]